MDVIRTVLSNGLTVLVHHDPSSEVAAVVTYVKAGYFDETDDVVGVAHVVEHMFFKGTPAYGVGEIARATKATGGYLNAHTIYDHTSYYVVLPARAFARGLEIQADAYARSLMDEQELRRELEVIIQEAKRKADTPPSVAIETLYELLHDVHRIRRWRIGREPGLRALTRDVVAGFYRDFYRPSNTILAVAGGVAPDTALREIERRYGALRDGDVAREPGPREPDRKIFRYRELDGDITKTQLLFGWRAPGVLDPAAPALDLASAVLANGRASRLYRAVRERQLAASVTAHNLSTKELGVFTIHAETEPENTVAAARAVWGETSRLADELLPGPEIERARRLYEARWLRQLETMEGRANYLAAWEALGDWKLGDAYLDDVRRLSPTRLRDAYREKLDADGAAVLVYRPTSAPVVAADAGELRRMLALLPPAVPPITRDPTPARTRPSTAELERIVGDVHVFRTRAGVPVLVRRRAGSPFAYMGAAAGAGASADSMDRAGLTLLVARTAIKGTRTRTAHEIAEVVESLGGTIAASAGGDSIAWSLAVPLAHYDAAIGVLAEVVQRPAFPVEALEIERGIALTDAAILRDDMFAYPVRLMTEAAFGAHAYAIPSSGTEEGLRRITVADLRGAHTARVASGPSVVVIVADEEPAVLAAIASAAFDELTLAAGPELEPPPWPQGKVLSDSRTKAQTAIAIGFPAPARRDHGRFALEAIARVASGLGGRFFDELRDKRSLAYTVHSFPIVRPRAGVFGTYIATSPEREDEALEGVLAEVRRLRTDPPHGKELARAQEYAVGTELIRRESGAALLGEIIEAWLFGELEELETYESSMRSVTTDDIVRIAAEYLNPAAAAVGIVRGTGRIV